MFALLRNLSLSSRTSRPCVVARHSRRALSYTPTCKAEVVEEPGFGDSAIFDGEDVPEDADELLNGRDEPAEDDEKKANRDPGFNKWLETIGKQYEEAHRPRNWLGEQVVDRSVKPQFQASDSCI
ncbi:hypothetical protein QCA50_010301 [Cerrena zonata]|uniref:Uncharacterized protein n=1 Tax=Cerrena zonata TaxID=2478898 RepID=A0AAW0GAR9_9APHY